MRYENRDLLDLYRLKVEEHWYTLFTPVLNYLGNIEGKKILDIGCGSGEFTDELARGAKYVVGIDTSKAWVAECQQKYHQKNLTFIKANATDLSQFKNHSFDIVIMNMVLPNIKTKTDMEKIFTEVSRVTKKSGQFIFSTLHPLCTMTEKEGARKQVYAKNFSYFKEGSKFSAIVTLPNKKEIEFTDNHWTLNFLTQILDELNMPVRRILESNYPKNAPRKFFRYSFPEYITLCCQKS